MLLKAALILAGLGLLWYTGNRIATAGSQAVGSVGNAISNAANAINPLNNDNVIYHTANWLTGGAENETLGGRAYDFFNPPKNTGGASGSW